MSSAYTIIERKGPPVLGDLPKPSLPPTEAINSMLQSNGDPKPAGQIASAWFLHTDRLDSLARIVEMLEDKFAPVCSPVCPKIESKPDAVQDARRQSDMADSLNFQSRRVMDVIEKLGSLIERCQL